MTLSIFWLVAFSAAPAQAWTTTTGVTEELEYVTESIIPGRDLRNLSVCYVTRSLRILGIALTSDILRYALSSDNCRTEARPISTDQMMTAQSLDLIPANIPTVARNDLDRNLRTYGLLTAIGLGLFAVIWRRMKSILGYDPKGPMRKRAAQGVVSVMCHAAQCDSHIGSEQIALIGRTARRLTRRKFKAADIAHMADQIDPALGAGNYITFGKGLRDREKDAMIHAALLVTMADGRMSPAEYEFVTNLANGFGMPGNDFRRVMQAAIDDLKA